MTPESIAEWFGGDPEGAQLFYMLRDLSHTWDDLIDKDAPVSDDKIHNAFLIGLAYLPLNRVYQRIQHVAAPLWQTVVAAYVTANQYERDKDPHGVEIAHGLRYAAGHILAYAMIATTGPAVAQTHMPAMWKAVVFERFEPYRKEHLDDHPNQV